MSDASLDLALPSRTDEPPVRMNDLRRQTESLRDAMADAVIRTMDSGWYVLGPEVESFEAEFAAFCGVRHAVGVGNGTDAIEIALRALGCGPGREVVTVANAGMYATAAILSVGAWPVFADIDPVTLTMAPSSLARRLSSRTSAVVVTHLYGQLADLDGALSAVAEHGIPIVEDCAQAHGAERHGRRAGSVGTVGCFSFYPTKNLGALGDSGALVTDDDGLARTLRSLRQYGWAGKYRAERPAGRNSRLDEIQAAVLRLKLPRLEAWNARRRDIIRAYREAAASGPVSVPDAMSRDHVGHLCVVQTEHRDDLRAFLGARGIDSDIHYPVPDYCQAALAGLGLEGLSLPETEAASRRILSLPCFPEMTDREVARVCRALAAFDAESRP